jgi:hypothetical protein
LRPLTKDDGSRLKTGLSLADLNDREGLVRLDRAFVAHLAATEVGLHDRLMTAAR